MPALPSLYFFLLLISAAPLTTQNAVAAEQSSTVLKYKNYGLTNKPPLTGLAVYLNTPKAYKHNNGEFQLLPVGEKTKLTNSDTLILMGRFESLVISSISADIQLEPEALTLSNLTTKAVLSDHIQKLPTKDLPSTKKSYKTIAYKHLMFLFDYMARAIEWVFVFVTVQFLGSNWGLGIIFLSLILKIAVLPISIYTVSLQRKVAVVQAKLNPVLADIKKNFDGEEAHHKLMAAHKELGVTPFYTLKPLFSTMIQLPVLIAVFNVLGQLPELSGQSFLWITDLSYPDSLGSLPFSIPLLGNQISALPFLMTLITVVSTVLHQNKHATAKELRAQRRNLYLMAAAFFVLFYPFPAAMVLYWSMANAWQIVQQKFVKI